DLTDLADLVPVLIDDGAALQVLDADVVRHVVLLKSSVVHVPASILWTDAGPGSMDRPLSDRVPSVRGLLA
ncbi:UNVERIFIED_CONTAM: hypothetical protein RF649_13045, partial [Kocuria sp. CPCC 205295]|uniref:hypothetical protein n=1 Tax=Kocuria sp. CPCC 205295 TaxID=3073557 RepID=UPI0036D90055